MIQAKGKRLMSDNSAFEIVDGVLLKYNGEDEDVVIPEDVEVIARKSFENCDWIKTINFPRGVKKIGEFAFSGCTSLTEINLPDTVEDIGWGAFSSCDSIESYVFPCSLRLRRRMFVDDADIPVTVPSMAFYPTERTCVLYGFSNDGGGGHDKVIIENLMVTDGITEIYHNAFGAYYVGDVIEATFPADVSLGMSTFQGTTFVKKKIFSCPWCGGEMKGIFGRKCTRCQYKS